MTVCYTQITLFMATSTARKTSVKSDLDTAKAIAILQKQVKANSEAIKQTLPRDKTQVSNNTVLSIVFVVLVAMIGWLKIDQNGLSQRLDKLDEKIDSNYKESSNKMDSNHKQIINILLKRK